jgi:hypothetical protein
MRNSKATPLDGAATTSVRYANDPPNRPVSGRIPIKFHEQLIPLV